MMIRYLVLGGMICLLLYSCGGKKQAVQKKTEPSTIYINPNNEVAIAGAVNFDDEESLSIYSAILKNVTGDKSGAYIGNKMDRLANYFENNLDYSDLLRAGEGVILEFDSYSNFKFNTGKTTLNSESKDILNSIILTLQQHKKVNLIIETHTDASGDEEVNMKLSQDRVQAIENYLVENGIENIRIKTKAFGESQPKVNNDTAENRKLNRRIEFGFYASEALKEEAKTATQ